MMTTGRFDADAQEMLAELGFEPCWVRDLVEGDTVMIEHEINRDAPTEMVVEGLHGNRFPDYTLYQWVGALTAKERKVHCSYGGTYPCWRLVKPVDPS